MNIENNTTRPLFEKVKDDISARIKSGEYPAGSKIPTEVELIKQYDVSRITIRRAIEELCKD
ncbi:GntR family transcriptional regulator, partial [Faecalicatena contorta]